MSDLILPNQPPSREVMKAAGDFLNAVVSQFPHVGQIAAPGFAIQIIVPGREPIFSLFGNLQTPGTIYAGGDTIPNLRPKAGG